MKGGARFKNDCITYFGTKQKNEKGEIICDFLIKNDNSELLQCANPFVFIIYYRTGNIYC